MQTIGIVTRSKLGTKSVGGEEATDGLLNAQLAQKMVKMSAKPPPISTNFYWKMTLFGARIYIRLFVILHIHIYPNSPRQPKKPNEQKSEHQQQQPKGSIDRKVGQP